jgi:hypothetical protein
VVWNFHFRGVAMFSHHQDRCNDQRRLVSVGSGPSGTLVSILGDADRERPPRVASFAADKDLDDGRRRPGASRWIRSASDVASRFCPGQVDRRFRVRAASLCSPTAYSYRCVLSTRARRPASKSVAVLCSDDDERISARSARASGSGMLLRLTPSFRDGWHPPGDNYWFNKMTSDGYSNLWLALAY